MNRPLLYCSRLNTWDRLKTLCLVLGLLSLTACQSVPSNAETPNLASLPRTLSVSGKGDVTIPTTMSQVRLGVEIQGKTAQQVQQQVAQQSQAVVKLLKSRKIEKLETTGISLNPNYTYKDGKQSISGYIGTNKVSFRVATENSGPLLDDAIKAGATRIDGISFVASDEAIAQAQQQAIQKASEDAIVLVVSLTPSPIKDSFRGTALNYFVQRCRRLPTQIMAKIPKINQITTITIAAILLVGLP